MTAKPGRRHQQGEETRGRILDATIEIAAERGYEGTSMSQIADRAGVSMSSIYWHFADKDSVIAAVLQRSYDGWSSEAVTDTPPSEGAGVREHLVASVRRDVLALTRHPEFLRLGLMLSLERRPDEPTPRTLFHAIRRRSLDRLDETFARLLGDVASTRSAAGQTLSRRLATLVMAAADGLFIAYQVAPDELDLDALMELFVGGLLDRALRSVDTHDVPHMTRPT